MTYQERVIHRRARILSGLAVVEHESPLIELTTGKKKAAWRLAGTRYAMRWALARARYHQIAAGLRAEWGTR